MSVSDNTAQLRRIQQASTAVLKELDRVCTLLGIRYVVYGGTAIGAVRHQGFIPWDDDVDVCMPRPDYERFLAEAPAVLDEKFEVMSSRSHPDFPRPFGVLGVVGSVFTPGVARNRSFRMPLGIDLFPLDPVPDDEAAFRRQSLSTWVWGRLLFLHGTPTPDTSLRTPLKQVASGVMHATHWVLKASGVTPLALESRLEKSARRFEGRGSQLLGDYSTQDPRRWSASLDELFPARRVPFGPITVMTAKDTDAILTRGYGDYMTLPPEAERVNHSASEVSFGALEPFLSGKPDSLPPGPRDDA